MEDVNNEYITKLKMLSSFMLLPMERNIITIQALLQKKVIILTMEASIILINHLLL